MTTEKSELRTIVRGMYDLQKLRMQMGNRVVTNFKTKLGQEPSTKEETTSAEAQNLLKSLRESYWRITDGVISKRGKVEFEGDGVIDTEAEFVMVESYIEILRREEGMQKRIAHLIEHFPIWTEFMSEVRGVGPLMAACIIAELDPYKAKYISSFWKFAGLDVADDGRGRSRRKEHLVERSYVDADGNDATRVGITFNPFIKNKLMGVLADSFVRQGVSHYEQIYRQYKNRLENHPDHQEKTKAHRNNMAKRYMVKMFLADLWVAWRELEGLPVTPTYAEAKLGLKHGAAV